MSDQFTVTGLVATIPRHVVTPGGLPITSFRLVSTQRRFDRQQQKWVDGESNWFTITSFRQLAVNAAGSLQKGQRVVVTGRLRIRDWESGEKTGTVVEVDAEALGHDLAWGTSSFSRTLAGSTAGPESAAVETDIETDAAEAPSAEVLEFGSESESESEQVPLPF